MPYFLANKHILLGITGSIAAYKSPDLVRRLREAGASVRVVMTENAKRFITPLTLQAVSGFPVHDDLFDAHAEAAMGHIALARWADLILVAPASADLMARLVQGAANDLLTTLCLATQAPILLAPAMNQRMWLHAVTQANVEQLQQRGIVVLGTNEGNQACGDVGPGRMLEPSEIICKLEPYFTTGDLCGMTVLITAGPTHEAIDPIRFISNHSSGKMGYALATAARDAGAKVILVSGPTQLPTPKDVIFFPVTTASEMQAVVLEQVKEADIFIAAAAVGDYHCEQIATQKIHKQQAPLMLKLMPNADIVSTISQSNNKPFIVGFAAETENVIANAAIKRQRKKMDMIIANEVGPNKGMGTDENTVTILGDELNLHFQSMSKNKLARKIIAVIAEQFKKGIA